VYRLEIHDKEGKCINRLPIEENIINALINKEKLEKEKNKRLNFISKSFTKK